MPRYHLVVSLGLPLFQETADTKPLNGKPAGQYLPPPFWLQEPANGSRGGAQAASTATATAGEQPAAEGEVNPAVPRIILYTRIANLLLSICMMITSLLAVLTTQSATVGVLACYVVVFSCLLCCFETHLKQVSKIIALNFGFMYSAKSRAMFMAFIGQPPPPSPSPPLRC